MPHVFESTTLGRYTLPQRFVMAPLTRNRSGDDGVPKALNATYYGQRAGAGLIISEGTQPSAVGQGYLGTPGIHNEEQVAGWARVADAVHEGDGRIFIQLMHVGRIAHPDNKHGLETVSASAIAAPGRMVTAQGEKPHVTPRALDLDEIRGVVEEHVVAARNAIRAGADGVEVHGANGYLIHQFLAPSSNTRTDAYGGSPEHRARFAIEVVRAVAAEIGADRVGLRISPGHNIQGVLETDSVDLAQAYGHLVDSLAGLDLAYLHVLADPRAEPTQDLRRRFGGPVIVNSGFGDVTTLGGIEDLLGHGLADLVAVGRPYLANPDLERRWREGIPLNEPDPDTFYGGGAEGYTDYPAA